MQKQLSIGIIRESKYPPDKRAPLTPLQLKDLSESFHDIRFLVEKSPIRCFNDQEYQSLGIRMTEDMSDCDILMGVKEVDIGMLIPEKTYLFFAHVAKMQEQNRELFREIVNKKITLIDYEYLVNDNGTRVVAFGRFAGIIGAYNGLRAYGLRTGRFILKPAHKCFNLEEMWEQLADVSLEPGIKILITGRGRVSGGALETISRCGVVSVEPGKFIEEEFDVPVVSQAGPEDYVRGTGGRPFDYDLFIKQPAIFESDFRKFTRVTDILVTGHFWAPGSPAFFTREEMKDPGFRISVIADISCDINGPVPSTIRTTTIDDPFYGFDPFDGREVTPFSSRDGITVMAIDNLPGELPRDASEAFGKQLIESALPVLLTGEKSEMIKAATITLNGELTPAFSYLDSYLKQ
jgi:alanine dehydrogenase